MAKGKQNKIRGKPHLTPKQQKFVLEYIVDNNGAAAARRAGYSEKTANAMAARLLAKVNIQQEISKAVARQEIRTEITADRVLEELARIAFLDVRKLYDDAGNLKKLSELSPDVAAALAELKVTDQMTDGKLTGRVTEAVCWNKMKALEMLARHFGMMVDKKEVSGPGGDAIEICWAQSAGVDNED